ncbi:hypothetical protein TSOC_011061 [Tetrabaena socialis]|uniref:Uncharacterized protein n=1 Tax=Tetrabaena socialis TaxID=47790 RepID=A0A2J7ZRP8_9CHLO|nr:hypothetical protein TSOC_011061 [Tetrabaena socialis]|eukprot:PNH02935.1 hypothetical protein TSOC_011061 [Tetrabaena socialis]
MQTLAWERSKNLRIGLPKGCLHWPVLTGPTGGGHQDPDDGPSCAEDEARRRTQRLVAPVCSGLRAEAGPALQTVRTAPAAGLVAFHAHSAFGLT